MMMKKTKQQQQAAALNALRHRARCAKQRATSARGIYRHGA